MSMIKLLNEIANAEEEMQRIADHWKTMIRNRPGAWTDDKIREEVGNDLEMLEYSPEQVASMVQTIMHMIRSE